MAENTQLVEYESNGEMVKISPTMIRRYLVNGGGNVSDGEVMMFMSLCRYQHLNPFLREAYLIKYGSNDPATIVTGKDVFTKRANADPRYKGKKAGIVVIKKDGTVEEREGTMVLPNETIVGGWAKIFIDGKEDEYQSVGFDEYAGRKKDGSLNSQWAKKPATMIRKVAVVQALREAFPDRFQGLYAQEEFQNISDVKLDTEKVVADEIKENANSVDFEESDIIEGTATEVTEEQAEDSTLHHLCRQNRRLDMTVYELIQELSQYNADTEVKFNFKGKFEADVKATFDRDSEDDEQEVTAEVESDVNLDYENISDYQSMYSRTSQKEPYIVVNLSY